MTSISKDISILLEICYGASVYLFFRHSPAILYLLDSRTTPEDPEVSPAQYLRSNMDNVNRDSRRSSPFILASQAFYLDKLPDSAHFSLTERSQQGCAWKAHEFLSRSISLQILCEHHFYIAGKVVL
jgi:hypothetical protein